MYKSIWSLFFSLFFIIPDIKSQGLLINPYVYSKYDAASTAFFTATGISDLTIRSAVDNLVVGLKTDGLWTKAAAIYPIVGGTAATHKWNLKDPRNSNAAYRLTFGGGAVTHSSTGMTGANSFANTYLNPNTVYPGQLMSIGVYVRTNSNCTCADMGALSSTNRYLQIYSRFGDTFYGQVNSNNTIGENTSNTDSRGWFFASRSATSGAGSCFIQKNNNAEIYGNTSSAIVNANIYFMAQNQAGTAAVFSNKQIAFGWIGATLTPTEADNLYLRIQTFQTALGRQL